MAIFILTVSDLSWIWSYLKWKKTYTFDVGVLHWTKKNFIPLKLFYLMIKVRQQLYNLPIVCTHTHFHDNNYFCSVWNVERGILYDKRLCEKRNTSGFYEASIMYYSLLKFDEMENEIGDNSERTSSCVQPNIIRTSMSGEGNWFSCLLNSTSYHFFQFV